MTGTVYRGILLSMTNEMTGDRMLTTVQAAERLGIKPRSVVQLIRRGKLAATRFGRDLAISEAEVERYRVQRLPAHRPPVNRPAAATRSDSASWLDFVSADVARLLEEVGDGAE